MVDPKGGSGKSSFVTYHEEIQGGAISLQPDETARQMKKSLIDDIVKYRSENKATGDSKPLDVVYVTVPRRTKPCVLVELGSVLEELKDGRLKTSFGGNSISIKVSPVHVVVMANTVPGLQTLSKDRWELWWIGNSDHDYLMQPVKTKHTVTFYSPRQRLVSWVVNLIPTTEHNYYPNEMDTVAELPENDIYKMIEDQRNRYIKTQPFPEIHDPDRDKQFRDCVGSTFTNQLDMKDAPEQVRDYVARNPGPLLKKYSQETQDNEYFIRYTRHRDFLNESPGNEKSKKKPLK